MSEETSDTAAPEPKPAHKPDPLRQSRMSGLWAGVIAMALVLTLLVVFIAQNTQQIAIHYFGWTAHTSAAIGLLIAVTAGIALTSIAGTLRILQLRYRVRRHGRR